MEHCGKCHRCGAGVTKFEVVFDGSVLPCAAFKGEAKWFTLGNIMQGDTLEECLERGKNHTLLNLLKYLAKQDVPVDVLNVTKKDLENLELLMAERRERHGKTELLF